MLFGHALGEVNRQLCVDHAPVPLPSCPFLRDVHHRQVQHLEKAVVRRKDRSGLGYFPQLPIKPFNRIGCVDQPLHLLRILEICAEIRPIFPPRPSYLAIFRIPLG